MRSGRRKPDLFSVESSSVLTVKLEEPHFSEKIGDALSTSSVYRIYSQTIQHKLFKFNALRQRKLTGIVDCTSGTAHVLLPRIAA